VLSYPNLFINNTELAPDETAASGEFNVRVSTVSAATGQATGTPINVTIASGQTATSVTS
jgi:hypothetical protein